MAKPEGSSGQSHRRSEDGDRAFVKVSKKEMMRPPEKSRLHCSGREEGGGDGTGPLTGAAGLLQKGETYGKKYHTSHSSYSSVF